MVETGTSFAISARIAVEAPTFPVLPLYMPANFTANVVTMFCSDPTFCIRVINIACWFLHVKQYCLLKIGFFLIKLPDTMLNVNKMLSYLFDIVVAYGKRKAEIRIAICSATLFWPQCKHGTCTRLPVMLITGTPTGKIIGMTHTPTKIYQTNRLVSSNAVSPIQ